LKRFGYGFAIALVALVGCSHRGLPVGENYVSGSNDEVVLNEIGGKWSLLAKVNRQYVRVSDVNVSVVELPVGKFLTVKVPPSIPKQHLGAIPVDFTLQLSDLGSPHYVCQGRPTEVKDWKYFKTV
jgi:hypothetical protein